MVARAVTLPEKMSKKSMTVKVVDTSTESVMLNRLRYGAGDLMALLRPPMQKSMVMRMTMSMNTFRR